MARDTGSPRADAESDFLRSRRHQVLSALAAWVRNDSHDVVQTLSFDEVVEALGRTNERRLGLQVIPLDAIVGSVDKVRDFDRRFRPTSSRSRERWERIAYNNRTGNPLPPIEVYKLGVYYFVIDGHHRVSVSRAMGLKVIDAYVTEIETTALGQDIETRADVEKKHWERIFLQRVPLPAPQRHDICVADPVQYGMLAEMAEAWSARTMHAEGAYLDRRTAALRWYDEEYAPVLEMVEEAGIRGDDEERSDAYMRVAAERYRLIREHEWNREIMAVIGKRVRSSSRKVGADVEQRLADAGIDPNVD